MTDHRQDGKARAFAALHVKGDPIVLYNAWDAGSAKAIAEAGARAIATGSWSVAAAQGYPDGEALPLDALERIAARITTLVDLPLSIDFEGGYAVGPDAVALNVERMIAAGAVGINFEDGVLGGQGIHPLAAQAARVRAIRNMADGLGLPLFINARTDLFLQAAPEAHAARFDEASYRAMAYAEAGASGFFAPGLASEALIERLCAASSLPVNIMMRDGVPPTRRLAELGVARVSHGPGPYRAAMAWLKAQAEAALQKGSR